MTLACPLLVAVHTAAASWSPIAPAPHAFSVARAAVSCPLVMVASEPATSRAKEVLEDAKNEEEEAYDEELAAAAAVARGDDAIAQLKKEAEAAVAALRDAAKPEVAAALEKKGAAKAGDKLVKALRKKSKSMTVVGEGFMMDGISLGGFDLNDPAYLSEQYRTGNCGAVVVRGAGCEGCLGDDALKATLEEQEIARGNFPGPLVAISRQLFIDEIQLASAKADGATGVLLPLNLNGAEQTSVLMAAAAELGLEAIVRVCDAEQLAAALKLDAKIVAFGDCTLAESVALLDALPSGSDAPVTVADMPFLDVRGAWKFRDLGFNAIIAGKSLLDVCVRDRVPPTAIIKAMNSKGSVKYGLGMQKGRLEGSKEFLGSMAM